MKVLFYHYSFIIFTDSESQLYYNQVRHCYYCFITGWTCGRVGVFSTCIIVDFSHYLLSKVLSFPSCVHGEASTPEGGDLLALAGLDLLVQMY